MYDLHDHQVGGTRKLLSSGSGISRCAKELMWHCAVSDENRFRSEETSQACTHWLQ